jgi:hypothetical protein
MSVAGLVLSGGLVACASSTPPPVAATTLSSGATESCRGGQFDADDPDPRCLHHHVSETAPPASSALKVTVHADSVAKAGHEADLVVEMRNVTAAPLAVDVDSSCAWLATATDGEHNSLESDCKDECEHGTEPNVLHVTLDPDGVVVKKVRFYAVQTRGIENDHDQCEHHSAGALPPGRYTVSVHLPWSGSADVPLTVTP